MSSIFRFKQFVVDQSGCAMKINTDGVLLGAFAQADGIATILDIGAGTGVIALMLAQRFSGAVIDAVELNKSAAETAERNFANVPFKNKPIIYEGTFQGYFAANRDKHYDLIVSNPPFYINSLESSAQQMVLAKHADVNFFEDLIVGIAQHLTTLGECWLILPLPTAQLVKQLAMQHSLFLKKTISIRSFAFSDPHREIIVLSRSTVVAQNETFVIYRDVKVYSDEYRHKLKDYFIIF